MIKRVGRASRGIARHLYRVTRLLVSPRYRGWGLAVLRERSVGVAEAQRHEWFNSDRMVGGHTIKSVVGTASKDTNADRTLAALVRSTKAAYVIELGTNVGLSGTYLASALPPNGRLVTVDQSAERQAMARSLFDRAGVSDRIDVVNASFTKVLDGVAKNGFDVAFVDGDHTYDATLWLVDVLLQHAHPGTVIVVDDINHSDEMRRAWDTIRARSNVAAISLSDFGVLEVESS